MKLITLTPQEVYLASMVGVRRRMSSMLAGMAERNGASRVSEAEAWFFNVIGAMGEVAAAKALGVYWPASLNAPKAEPDLPPNWQIRTLAAHHYDLIVRDNDIDDHRYVLVTGNGPEFRVHGWITGADAKHPDWRRDRGERNAPAYWVPQASLVQIGELASA